MGIDFHSYQIKFAPTWCLAFRFNLISRFFAKYMRTFEGLDQAQVSAPLAARSLPSCLVDEAEQREGKGKAQAEVDVEVDADCSCVSNQSVAMNET